MRPRPWIAGFMVPVVVLMWVFSVGLRLPLLDQVPVYDADATTSEAHMWARIWWDEGALKMWFTTPRSPRSIERPTMASRGLYESWPPGAFVPIYLAAKLFGMQPSIPVVNWVNAVLHGIIALTVAVMALSLGRLNRFGEVASGVIGIAAATVVLFAHGPLYVFSQVYDVTTAVLPYTTMFLLLEVLYYSAASGGERRRVTALQLITIFFAFGVDWLSYTLFAFWIVSRLVAGYLGIEKRLTLRRLIGLSLVPIGGVSLFMVWRLFAPGSSAHTEGIARSLGSLAYKILERMNLT